MFLLAVAALLSFCHRSGHSSTRPSLRARGCSRARGGIAKPGRDVFRTSNAMLAQDTLADLVQRADKEHDRRAEVMTSEYTKTSER